MDVDQEVLRVTRLLEALAKVEKVSQRELERGIGVSGGTLYKILTGKIEIKLWHILAVLEVLEVSPAAFFESAFDERTPTDQASSAWILDQVKNLLQGGGPPSGRPGRDDAEIQRLIRKTLQEMGVGPAVPPEKPDKPT